jgi:hypothetical protein
MGFAAVESLNACPAESLLSPCFAAIPPQNPASFPTFLFFGAVSCHCGVRQGGLIVAELGSVDSKPIIGFAV